MLTYGVVFPRGNLHFFSVWHAKIAEWTTKHPKWEQKSCPDSESQGTLRYEICLLIEVQRISLETYFTNRHIEVRKIHWKFQESPELGGGLTCETGKKRWGGEEKARQHNTMGQFERLALQISWAAKNNLLKPRGTSFLNAHKWMGAEISCFKSHIFYPWAELCSSGTCKVWITLFAWFSSLLWEPHMKTLCQK